MSQDESAGSGGAFSLRERKRAQWILATCCFLDMVGFGLVLPLMPIYARELGVGPFDNGLILAIYPVTHLILAPWVGSWSDRVGRKLPLMIAAAGSAPSYLLLSWADSAQELAVFRLFSAVFTSAEAVCYAAMCDLTSKKERSQGMALLGAATALGFVVGPAISGFLVEYGIHVPFLVAGASSLLYFLAVVFLLPKFPPVRAAGTPGTNESVFSRIRKGLMLATGTPAVWVLIVLFASGGAGRVIWESTFGLFITGNAATRYSERDFAWMLVVVGGVSATLQLFLMKKLRSWLSDPVLAALGGANFGLGCGILAIVQSPWMLVLALILLGSGFALFNPCVLALLSKQVPGHSTGAVLGLAKSAGYSTRALAVGGAGLLFQLNATLPIQTAAIIHGLCAIVIPLLLVVGILEVEAGTRQPGDPS